jgi:hypothetical protein
MFVTTATTQDLPLGAPVPSQSVGAFFVSPLKPSRDAIVNRCRRCRRAVGLIIWKPIPEGLLAAVPSAKSRSGDPFPCAGSAGSRTIHPAKPTPASQTRRSRTTMRTLGAMGGVILGNVPYDGTRPS